MPPEKPILAIIIPCYNEEEVIPQTVKYLSQKINQLIEEQVISPHSKLFFVDDGSTDNTWNTIERYKAENPSVVSGIKLSANYGHQQALLYGLLSAMSCADITISIDADLQDDINAIDKMLEYYLCGCEIVYGVRSGRESDNFFKRITANLFYRFMRLSGANLIANHADFRLMSKAAVNTLAEYNTKRIFLRGIIPGLGFKSGIVYYSRKKRLAGKSKYTLPRMIKFAFDGVICVWRGKLACSLFMQVFLFFLFSE